MTINKNLLGGSAALLVLSLIKEKDMYGFEIILELENRSDQTFQLKEGTLYPILHKLEKKELLETYQLKGERGRKRKYYRITEKGIKQLSEEIKQWESFTNGVQKVIGEVHALT